jgi:hypothetical protein
MRRLWNDNGSYALFYSYVVGELCRKSLTIRVNSEHIAAAVTYTMTIRCTQFFSRRRVSYVSNDGGQPAPVDQTLATFVHKLPAEMFSGSSRLMECMQCIPSMILHSIYYMKTTMYAYLHARKRKDSPRRLIPTLTGAPNLQTVTAVGTSKSARTPRV